MKRTKYLTVAFTCDKEKNIIVYNSTEEKTELELFLEENGEEIILFEAGRK